MKSLATQPDVDAKKPSAGISIKNHQVPGDNSDPNGRFRIPISDLGVELGKGRICAYLNGADPRVALASLMARAAEEIARASPSPQP